MVPRDKQPKADRKTLTFRLTQRQHKRVRAFVAETETSIQATILAGISRMMVERGFPPL